MPRDDRDPATGRFIKGHKPPAAAGRPIGAVNKLSKSVAEEVREGLADITKIIADLVKNKPESIVPLIKHMMPSGEPDDALGGRLVIASINRRQRAEARGPSLSCGHSDRSFKMSRRFLPSEFRSRQAVGGAPPQAVARSDQGPASRTRSRRADRPFDQKERPDMTPRG
jgi:hypothetical protein